MDFLYIKDLACSLTKKITDYTLIEEQLKVAKSISTKEKDVYGNILDCVEVIEQNSNPNIYKVTTDSISKFQNLFYISLPLEVNNINDVNNLMKLDRLQVVKLDVTNKLDAQLYGAIENFVIAMLSRYGPEHAKILIKFKRRGPTPIGAPNLMYFDGKQFFNFWSSYLPGNFIKKLQKIGAAKEIWLYGHLLPTFSNMTSFNEVKFDKIHVVLEFKDDETQFFGGNDPDKLILKDADNNTSTIWYHIWVKDQEKAQDWTQSVFEFFQDIPDILPTKITSTNYVFVLRTQNDLINVIQRFPNLKEFHIEDFPDSREVIDRFATEEFKSKVKYIDINLNPNEPGTKFPIEEPYF